MSGKCRIRFTSIAVIALTAMAGGGAAADVPSKQQPVSAIPVTASYEVYFGGFHVLNAEARLENGGENYRISAAAETQGMLGWFNPWKGETETQGRIVADKVVPQRHDNRGTADEGERIVTLRYDEAGNIVEAEVLPEQDWEDRHPLPADAGEGTLDPLSIIAGLAQLLQKGGTCEGRFAVFDGRKRYDLTVADAGTQKLAPNDYSIFNGEAQGCRLDYEMLGGHRIERSKYAATARERVIWVARPAADAPLIPVRLQIETAYGTVMGHLTGYRLGDPAEALLTD
ncbi:DUF3108 domain-containing protein [Pelagibius sp.]|uniref:DUF3108 domain-containing protein n=1 Tax=Pelagibius sp. TaxID=1931238 RepID=UPI003BAF0064